MKKTLCLAFTLLMLLCICAVADTTTIPVISLYGECLVDYSNWNDKSTYQPATLTYEDGNVSFTKAIEIKPQGTTSLYAPKKNFTIQFSEGVELVESWGAQEKYVLKADYIDPTVSSNVVSAKLAAEMNEKYGVFEGTPNYGVIDGFPVFVKINGQGAGLFNVTIPKDAWLFNMDERNPAHMVLSCEGWSPASRMQSADIDFEVDWAFEVGEATEENKAAFTRMVEFVATADDKAFVENFDQYLDLDACINYLCFINTAYGNDNVAKNMLMVTYDGKVWQPALYDLDSLWGIGYDGTALAEAEGQWSEELLTDGNCLLYRVNHLFKDQVKERYFELREGILSKEHIMESFEAYMSQIPESYYEINNALWYEDGLRIRTIELMGQLMDEYIPIVDKYYETMDEVTTEEAPVHYVWAADGITALNDNAQILPVTMTISYTLDGNSIEESELYGKSGKLETKVKVERNADANHIYGLAAIVHVNAEQVKNLSVTGASYQLENQQYVVMGNGWLGGTNNVYEMNFTMDVTSFEPCRYLVVAAPMHIDGGDDNSLEALLATAGELTTIINEGVQLHESLVEMHSYLSTMQMGLAQINGISQGLIPEGTENTENKEDALSIIKTMLADAENEADELLKAWGYELTEEAGDRRIEMLTEVTNDEMRTEDEKAEAIESIETIQNYQTVVNQMDLTSQSIDRINTGLSDITKNLPDLVGAYGYFNDHLYAIVYKISTLYQDLSNYYYANNDGGEWIDFSEFDNWYDVIIFSNFESVDAF